MKSQFGNINAAHNHNIPKEYDYNKDLRSDNIFHNPYGLDFMRSAFLINEITSFVSDNEHYHISDFYDQIRLQQNRNWAQKEIEEGVKLAKQGHHKEAMGKYQDALDADPQNTDALVARGASFFNVNMIAEAIDSFKQALDIQPRHQNAKKYLDIASSALAAKKKSEEKHEKKRDILSI